MRASAPPAPRVPPLALAATAFVLLGLSALLPSVAAASPQDLFGYGGRTPGLAMTGTSYADGLEAVFANPAGLAAMRRRQLVFGFVGGGYQLTIDGERDNLTPPRGNAIGFTLPLPFGDFLEDRLVIGGAFYTPAEVILRARVRFPSTAQWSVLDRAQVLAIQVGLGFDFHGIVDGLTLGVTVSALADVFGELDVELDETNSFSSTVETQLLTSFSPIVGARYTQPEWGIGVSYRHELISRLDLDVRTMDLPVTLPVLRVGGLVQYDPPTLIAEGYWRPIPQLTLILNLTTRFWSEYPGVQVPTTSMGLNAPHPRFETIPSPRLAVEGTLIDDQSFIVQLRAGYAFEASPAPPASTRPRRTAEGVETGEAIPVRFLDNDRHIVTAGLGFTVHLGTNGERLVIDAFGQIHALTPRTHEIGLEDGGAPLVTAGFIGMAGWTLGVEF